MRGELQTAERAREKKTVYPVYQMVNFDSAVFTDHAHGAWTEAVKRIPTEYREGAVAREETTAWNQLKLTL